MDDPVVQLKRDGPLARIVLNRPSARNALSVSMCHALLQTIDEAALLANGGEVRVVILEGQGTAFCAGADLKERGAMAPAAMSAHSRLIARCADQLANFPCPTIAAVKGAALGGGFELVLACDLRVASTEAVFGFPEVKYGFFPGAGGPVRLTRLVGLSTATYLLMSGDRITGDDAARRQIVHLAMEASDVNAKCTQLAEQLASFPPKGVRALRQLLASLDRAGKEEGMVLARQLRDELDHDPQVQSVLRAFRAA